MEKLIDITINPILSLLDLLLDKTTKHNIIWTTNIYAEYDKGFSDKE